MEEKVEKKVQKAPTFMVNKRNNNIALVIVLAVIGGMIGGVMVSFLIGGTTSINEKPTVGTVANSIKKYEIEQTNSPVVAVADAVSKSVVGIKVKYSAEVFRGFSTEAEGEGSGIIYNKDGYIITNYHVIQEAATNTTAKIEVVLSGTEEWIPATVIGYDKITDLAVIKVEKEGLKAANFGKSKDLKVGEIVAAIGNPLGSEFAGTVTSGVVSALDRSITTDGRTYKLIQTDAAINTGNSGGALANTKGEVIGINTVKIIATGVEGIGFAIPSDEAVPIIEELIKNKKIARPSIGIMGLNITDSMIATYKNLELGIYVSEVVEKGPAEKAGVKAGDIIIKAQDKKIETMDELNKLKYSYKIGDKFKITVKREGKEVNLEVVLGEE
ncbi:MAG: trypsin-like peptidase domain-containing protein [Clostridia bacterium]|nr:trypsin-like peptidase domain-containing protein [Clostridia bacterium]MDD4376031.1 trypsin-like peptidase domain-containing protein [Clostridia bacterium]